jgi:2-oxoisovalerate dehydrogenase E1 component
LYRLVYQDVPIDYYTLPLAAALIKEGNDVTVIAFAAVHCEAAHENAQRHRQLH